MGYTIRCYPIHVFPLIYNRRLAFTGSARVTCAAAVHHRFLHSERARFQDMRNHDVTVNSLLTPVLNAAAVVVDFQLVVIRL